MTQARGVELDPITFEVIRHRLWAINDDQATSSPSQKIGIARIPSLA